MGREQAAIALAVVSTKDPATFPDDPGRVFPRHVSDGKGRRAEPRPHAVGDAAGCWAKAKSEDGIVVMKSSSWPKALKDLFDPRNAISGTLGRLTRRSRGCGQPVVSHQSHGNVSMALTHQSVI